MIEKASDLLKGIIGKEELNTANRISSVFGGWEKIAGTDIASHSQVKDIRHGVIIIEVDHPGWIQMIQMKRVSMLKALSRKYKELHIKDMRCIIQPTAKQDTPDPAYTYKAEENEVNNELPEDPGREGFDHLLGRLADSISRRDKDLES